MSPTVDFFAYALKSTMRLYSNHFHGCGKDTVETVTKQVMAGKRRRRLATVVCRDKSHINSSHKLYIQRKFQHPQSVDFILLYSPIPFTVNKYFCLG